MEAREQEQQDAEIVPPELYYRLSDELRKQKYWGSVVTDYHDGSIVHVKLNQGLKKQSMERFLKILTQDATPSK